MVASGLQLFLPRSTIAIDEIELSRLQGMAGKSHRVDGVLIFAIAHAQAWRAREFDAYN